MKYTFASITSLSVILYHVEADKGSKPFIVAKLIKNFRRFSRIDQKPLS